MIRSIFLSLACLAVTVFAQESTSPYTMPELSALLAAPEAERPSEEVAQLVRRRLVAFRPDPQSLAAVRAAGQASKRPEDGMRQVVQAVQESWLYARLKSLASADPSLRTMAADMVERRLELQRDPVFEKEIMQSGAAAAGWIMWPPAPPADPRLRDLVWRPVDETVVEAPLSFNNKTVFGTADFDMTVDGRALLVIKHRRIYNLVICGQPLLVQKAVLSGPIPPLPLDEIEYSLDYPKGAEKPKGGFVFACPQDPRCQLGNQDKKVKDRHCIWNDIDVANDDRGVPHVRFFVDDVAKGAHRYQLRLKWAVRPFTLATVLAEMKTSGAAKTRELLFARGVSFKLLPVNPETQANQAKLEASGADESFFREVNRNFRISNMR